MSNSNSTFYSLSGTMNIIVMCVFINFWGRSQLEYVSLIQYADNIGVTHNFEAVQNRFFAFFQNLNLNLNVHDIQIIVEYIIILQYIQSLNTRKSNLHYSFLLKPLNNSVDCTHLLERIIFRINTKSTKNQESLLINSVSKTYLKLLPANILMAIGKTMDINFS